MATQRYISSSFWSDDWVDSLNIKEKLLYMYLLTNECTSISGVYKITIKRIKDDTGISREEVQSILNKFAKAKKAYYFNEHIILPTWLKHQHLNNQKVNLGVRRALNALSNEIIDFLRKENHFYYDIDDFIDNNKNEQKSDKPYKDVTQNDMSYTEKPSKSDESYPNKQLLPDDLDSDLDSDLDLKEPPQDISQAEPENFTDTQKQQGEEEAFLELQKAKEPALTKLAEEIYPIFVDLKLNKPNSFINFLMRDFRIGLDNLRKAKIKIDYDILQACKNYAELLMQKRLGFSTWWNFSGHFDAFCKGSIIIQFMPDRFDLKTFERSPPNTANSKNDYTKQDFSQESTDGYFQDRGLENAPLEKIDTDKVLENTIF